MPAQRYVVDQLQVVDDFGGLEDSADLIVVFEAL
jgi:hypothetical protein